MQLQFEKQGISCLQTVKRGEQTQEQTQEVRISDGMPDIGSIISVWGQVILRSKEWQNDAISVGGGTMVWVLYRPEGGGEPCCVESWLPFQLRWNLPQNHSDGVILTRCLLLSADARSTSARKLMLRTNVWALAWAMEQSTRDLYLPENIPEDVQLRSEQYPMQMPAEAGEKAFTLEESLSLPAGAPSMENLISYSLQPQITEEKLMGDKVVFRGNGNLHLCYRTQEGDVHSLDFELPFTQYGELAGDYGSDAEGMLWPCVTALEIDRQEDRLEVKAGLVCQYLVSHRILAEVVTDAYSVGRTVEPIMDALELPGILESESKPVQAQLSTPTDAMGLSDVQFTPLPVRSRETDTGTSLELPGRFQLLYYDLEGNLQAAQQTWDQQQSVANGPDVTLDAMLWMGGKTQGNLQSGTVQLRTEGKLTIQASSNSQIPMVKALELGELQAPDPCRPSLILRRAGERSLWQLAKECGSTVSAIRQANHLDAEPDREQMLLIPVI